MSGRTPGSQNRRKQLTARQELVYKFIQESIRDRGYPPTIREIGVRLEIRSTNGVNDHLKALERKGYITRDDMKSRALRPVTPIHSRTKQPQSQTRSIPILGRIAAGLPLLAQENVEDTVEVDSFFIGSNKEVFALRVVGESMIEDGIHDGDYIFIRKQVTANRGDIVVALIEDEATVKRYYPEGERIRLQPANSAMEPIYVRRDEFKQTSILGLVVGVYRKM
jgi:repressor LexA